MLSAIHNAHAASAQYWYNFCYVVQWLQVNKPSSLPRRWLDHCLIFRDMLIVYIVVTTPIGYVWTTICTMHRFINGILYYISECTYISQLSYSTCLYSPAALLFGSTLYLKSWHYSGVIHCALILVFFNVPCYFCLIMSFLALRIFFLLVFWKYLWVHLANWIGFCCSGEQICYLRCCFQFCSWYL